MNLVSFPASTINGNRLIISKHLPRPLCSCSEATHLSKVSVHKNLTKTNACVSSNVSPNSPFSYRQHVIRITSSLSRKRRVSLVPFDAKNPSSSELGKERDEAEGEEDHQGSETVPLKLYSAIKNQNIRELSDVIRDECQRICNFFMFFPGKKQVPEFVTCLIRRLVDNIEFIVRPNLEDGMDVGVSWRLEWSKKHVPLGKGLSLYIRQIYQGKLLIRNLGMLIEVLPIEPLRLKIMENVMAAMDMLSFCKLPKGMIKKTLWISLLVLFFMIVLLLFSKPGFY